MKSEKRPNEKPTVCVIGDVVINWLDLKKERKERQGYDPIMSIPLAGGAWFVRDAIAVALEKYGINVNLIARKLNKSEEIGMGSKVPQSVWRMNRYSQTRRGAVNSNRSEVVRIMEICGYDTRGVVPCYDMGEYEAGVAGHGNYNVLVIDDMGLGFRDKKSNYEEHIQKAMDCNGLVVLLISEKKIEKKIELYPMWKYIADTCRDRAVAIVGANSLRNGGAIISRRISWESTAEDFVGCTNKFESISVFKRLVVRFGISGVACRLSDEKKSFVNLHFDTKSIDGGYSDERKEGKSTGGNSIVAASIVRSELSNEAGTNPTLDERIGHGAQNSIGFMQSFYSYGFGESEECINKIKNEDMKVIFSGSGCFECPSGVNVGSVLVPFKIGYNRNMYPERFDILVSEFSKSTEEEVERKIKRLAYNIVRYGVDQALEAERIGVPVARFGGIVSIDRRTTESYRNLRTLIDMYIKDKTDNRPLSIAAFGDPGSGKSFTIREIASCVSESIRIETLNLSSVENVRDDMTKMFVRVLDLNQTGYIPLVLFDEFDCDDLKHLVRFLEPMEDGTFPFGEHRLHFGKCIFVFAGGTRSSYKQFEADCINESNKSLKCRDFVSRIRWCIDVNGIDSPVASKSADSTVDADGGHWIKRVQDVGGTEHAYLIRRAMLLREFLVKRKLVDGTETSKGQKEALVDGGIINALLGVDSFKNGARSMRILVSLLHEEDHYLNSSSVPPRIAMEMQAYNAEKFMDDLANPPSFDEPSHQEKFRDEGLGM